MWLGTLLAVISMGGVIALQELKPQAPPTEGVVFDFNERFATFSADSLRFMSFGYARIMSNLLWLRFLQHTPPKSMGANEVSWIYLDLDAISSIDPEFEPVFTQGAVFLSVITGDKKGAEQLFKKCIHLFPRDWRCYSFLGYHYHFEMNDMTNAERYYSLAAERPDAPVLFKLLAGSLKAKTQGHYASVEFLRRLRDSSDDLEVKDKLDRKILDLLNKYDGPNQYR